jgi:hypothetical protein
MILAFIGSVFLVMFTLLLSFRLTLFSERHFQSVIKQTNYVTTLTKEINTNLQGVALGSNVPKSVLKNAVPEKVVAQNINKYIHSIYQPSETFEIEGLTTVEQNITQKITDYANQNQLSMVSESSIAELSNHLVEQVKEYIALPYLVNFGQRIMSYRLLLSAATVVLGIITLVILFILYRMLRGFMHRLLRFSSYIFISSGFMAAIFPTILLINHSYTGLKMESKSMETLFSTYISSFLWQFIIIGGIFIVLGVLSAILSETLRGRLVKR